MRMWNSAASWNESAVENIAVAVWGRRTPLGTASDTYPPGSSTLSAKGRTPSGASTWMRASGSSMRTKFL